MEDHNKDEAALKPELSKPIRPIQGLAIYYNPAEDRIWFDCNDSVIRFYLYLTRRLTRQLLSLLAKSLTESSKLLVHTPVNARVEVMAMEHIASVNEPISKPVKPNSPAKPIVANDEVMIKHPTSKDQKNTPMEVMVDKQNTEDTNQSKASSQSKTEERGSSIPTSSEPPPPPLQVIETKDWNKIKPAEEILLNRIAVNWHEGMFQISFASDSELQNVMVMSRSDFHKFFNMLYQTTIKAEWEITRDAGWLSEAGGMLAVPSDRTVS